VSDNDNLLAAVAHFETHSRRQLASLVDRANADPDIGFHLALKEEESPTIKAGGGIPAPVRPFITITAVPKPARRSIGSQLAGAPPVPEPQGPNIQISMTVAGQIHVQLTGDLKLTSRGPYSPAEFDDQLGGLIADFIKAAGRVMGSKG
jgi:hypothetical protein